MTIWPHCAGLNRGYVAASRRVAMVVMHTSPTAAPGTPDVGGRTSYDLVHAHHWRSGIAALSVALERGVPFVQSFHSLAAMKNRSLAPGEAVEPPLRLRSEIYLAQQADAVIAVTAAEVSSLLDGVGAATGRVWVVPPGVDTQSLSAADENAAKTVLARPKAVAYLHDPFPRSFHLHDCCDQLGADWLR